MCSWSGARTRARSRRSSPPSRPTFFTTPHYDGHPSVLVRFGAADVELLTELLTESWRLRAPAKVVAAYDAEHPPEG